MLKKPFTQHLLKNGSLLNGGLAAVIFSSLYVNPMIWMHDAPTDIREKAGPKNTKTKWQTILIIAFFTASRKSS